METTTLTTMSGHVILISVLILLMGFVIYGACHALLDLPKDLYRTYKDLIWLIRNLPQIISEAFELIGALIILACGGIITAMIASIPFLAFAALVKYLSHY